MMEKLNGKSKDIIKENIDKLKQIFPEIITEGNIDFDKLKNTLGEYVDDREERYNFTWNGKAQAKRLAQTPSSGTLRPCKAESVNWDNTENLFIEGDNLEVLKLLQKTYHKKIKMIYIDPPYNTGKDFVYKDDFRDNIKNYKELTGQVDGEGKSLSTNSETSGRYHTDWLNMMYPRLKLARNLLRDDGVIFISIDDNEIHNLRKISEDIFGEENFIGILSVENNPKGRKNSEFISVSSEYLMIFAKNKAKSHFIENIPKNAKDMTEDESGKFVHNSGKRVLVGENSFNKPVVNFNSDKNYSVYYRETDKSFVLKKEEFASVNHKLLSEGYVKYYSHDGKNLVENTYTDKKIRDLFENEALVFSQDKIYEKNFNDTIRIKSQLVNRKYEAIVNGKKQEYSMELTTTGAGTHLKCLFEMNDLPFTAPKNVGYLKLIISLFENEPFIVLDFFSGSSSTADAVMQLNFEDFGNRKFIMVQFPELCDEKSEAFKAGYKTIADIGKERIRRVIKQIEQEQVKDKKNGKETIFDEAKQDDKPLDFGFKVFKLDSSNIKAWDSDFDTLEKSLLDSVNNIKQDRSSEDVLYEILLKYGLDLTLPIEERKICNKTVYSIGLGALIVCLDKDISLDVVEGIAKLKEELSPEISRVVFSDTGFEDDVVKTNTVQILKQHGIEDVKSI